MCVQRGLKAFQLHGQILANKSAEPDTTAWTGTTRQARSMNRTLARSLALSTLLLPTACDGESDVPEPEAAHDAEQDASLGVAATPDEDEEPELLGASVLDDPYASEQEVLDRLSASGRWELTANPIREALGPVAVPKLDASRVEEYRRAALADDVWYSADGKRYEALYIEHGRAFGRLGPAPDAPSDSLPAHGPSDVTNLMPSDEAIEAGLERLAAMGELGPRDEAEGFPSYGDDLDSPGDPIGDGIGVDSSDDRRLRYSNPLTLDNYPNRTIGAMSHNGNTGWGGCTGTKIAPRAVLTASHCLLSGEGETTSITTNGYFNPGQTAYEAVNGSIRWSGAYLRDWRIAFKYDYAIIFLSDSPSTVGLGWMNVAWYNSQSGYDSLGTIYNKGFPAGRHHPDGSVFVQTCKASPRSDKRCEGYMYGHHTGSDVDMYSGYLLSFENDVSAGHSGGPVYAYFSGSNVPAILTVVSHGVLGSNARGPRFRTSMWNDICSWIGLKPSLHGSHACQ